MLYINVLDGKSQSDADAPLSLGLLCGRVTIIIILTSLLGLQQQQHTMGLSAVEG